MEIAIVLYIIIRYWPIVLGILGIIILTTLFTSRPRKKPQHQQNSYASKHADSEYKLKYINRSFDKPASPTVPTFCDVTQATEWARKDIWDGSLGSHLATARERIYTEYVNDNSVRVIAYGRYFMALYPIYAHYCRKYGIANRFRWINTIFSNEEQDQSMLDQMLHRLHEVDERFSPPYSIYKHLDAALASLVARWDHIQSGAYSYESVLHPSRYDGSENVASWKWDRRAMSKALVPELTPLYMDKSNKFANFASSAGYDPYITTLSYCSCLSSKMPCKHMLRLGSELGLISCGAIVRNEEAAYAKQLVSDSCNIWKIVTGLPQSAKALRYADSRRRAANARNKRHTSQKKRATSSKGQNFHKAHPSGSNAQSTLRPIITLDELRTWLTTERIPFVDKTLVGGCLWFEDSPQVAQIIPYVKIPSAYLSFTPKGSKNTNYRPSWYVKL